MTDPAARLASIVRLSEFEPLARAAVDPAYFEYVTSGSWDEVSLAENDAAWLRRRFRPRVLVDVSRVDPSTTLLGSRSAFPLATAPMATHGMAHADGELATARAAAAAGVPFTLSTMSSRTIEEVAAATPDSARWFQLYITEDRAQTRSLVERATAAGYRAIMLTVDLAVVGYRERDLRSGFELSALGNFGSDRPSHRDRLRGDEDMQESKGLSWDDLSEIRSWSTLPLVLKGIMTAEDACLAVEHGVDGIVVSNHGARQLDRTLAPVDMLADIAKAVDGRAEIWVDGGVRRGLDIAIALALGAGGVLVGRPIVWALAAGGQAGVERALAILRQEFELALALLGAPAAADVRPEHLVSLDPRVP